MPEPLWPAVFIDRDGTLMRDVDYCGNPADVEVFEGAGEALRQLKKRGYKIVVITNQSGIGRGYYDERSYRAVAAEVDRQLGPGVIDATYFCPHAPNQPCDCRKPAPGMVRQAAQDHQIDLGRSYFMGDKDSDIECGRRAGTKTILVETGYGQSADHQAADAVVPDIPAAVHFILQSRDSNAFRDANR